MPAISSALTLPLWPTNLPTLVLKLHLPKEGDSELSHLFSLLYVLVCAIFVLVRVFCLCQLCTCNSLLWYMFTMYMSKCVVVSMFVCGQSICVVVYVYVAGCDVRVMYVLCVCRGVCFVRSLLSSSPKMRRCYCTVTFGRDIKLLVPRLLS